MKKLMARKLTKKQKGFIKDYLDTGNGTESALKNYDIQAKDPEKSASVIASNLLGKISIREKLESHAESAESKVFELSQNAKSEMVSLVASKDILDRAGYKPIEKSQSVTVNLDVKEVKEVNEEIQSIARRIVEESKLKAIE